MRHTTMRLLTSAPANLTDNSNDGDDSHLWGLAGDVPPKQLGSYTKLTYWPQGAPLSAGNTAFNVDLPTGKTFC